MAASGDPRDDVLVQADPRAEDLALARRALGGGPAAREAQERLLVRLLPHLRAVARTMLADPADVADAVQGATLKMIEGLSGFRGDARLERWARTIVVRECLDRRAARRRREESSLDAESLPDVATGSLGETIPDDLRAYLAQLTEDHREVIVLRHALGHTVAEIADLLGVPPDTVKSRLVAGRRRLRAAIRRDLALGRRGRVTAPRWPKERLE